MTAFAALLVVIALQQGVDSNVVRAKDAIAPMTDSAVLHKAGYFAIGFNSSVKDLTPFQGQHWLAVRRFLANAPLDLAKPMFMMYLPVGDSLIPVGVAHSIRIPKDSALPLVLGGVKSEWHSHSFCLGIPGEGQALADGPEDCKARGGNSGPNQIAMVHTWTVANPDGPYAHDNPSLPFLATGLKPPSHAMADERLFGIALGESYGARLVAAHRIDLAATKAGTRQPLEDLRAPLKALVPQLRAAEKAGDTKKFDNLRKQTIAAWSALAEQYRKSAETPEMKARFDLELAQAIGTMKHNHM